MHLCISRTTFSLKAFGPWLTLLSLANSAMSQILEAARMINGHKVVEGMDTRTQAHAHTTRKLWVGWGIWVRGCCCMPRLCQRRVTHSVPRLGRGLRHSRSHTHPPPPPTHLPPPTPHLRAVPLPSNSPPPLCGRVHSPGPANFIA